MTVESLDVGDASFRLDIEQSGTDQDGTVYSVTATAAGAVVDDVVITFTVSAYEAGGEADVPDVVVDAVEAAADAAG